MIGIFVFFALLLSAGSYVHAQCDIPDDRLGALFEIREENSNSGQVEQHHLWLWRRDGQVAYEFPELGITEIWSRAPGRGMYLVRYFDEQSRAIEYQPGELQYARPDTAWSDKQQLVASTVFDSMSFTGSSGAGCQLIEFYGSKSGASVASLNWMPQLRLPKLMTIGAPGKVQEWRLLETVQSVQRINAVFTSRQHYAATDYADIGDNESDPFLMKMTRLGFVERGSSGFYDEHGQALKGALH